MAKPILYLAGPHGAGKTHAATELIAEGFASIDLGPTIRRLHREADSGLSLGDWIAAQEAIHGKNFTDNILRLEMEKLVEQVKDDASVPGILVLGSRSLENIRYLSAAFNHVAPSQKILYIDAPLDILKQRYESREQKTLTAAEFDEILQKDEKMGLSRIKLAADHVIINSGTAEEFSAVLQKTLTGLGYRTKPAERPHRKTPKPK